MFVHSELENVNPWFLKQVSEYIALAILPTRLLSALIKKGINHAHPNTNLVRILSLDYKTFLISK